MRNHTRLEDRRVSDTNNAPFSDMRTLAMLLWTVMV